MSKIANTINRHFPNENFAFLITGIISLVALSIHVVLVFFYLFIGLKLIALINCVSVFIYIISAICSYRRLYTAAGLIITFEIIVYTAFATIFLGIATYSILYLFLVLILQLILPYASIRVRIAVSIVIWVVLIGLCLVAVYCEPLIQTEYVRIIALFNINITFVTILIELLIGDMVRSIMANSKEVQINELEKMANIDLLTGVNNRNFAEQYFKQIDGKSSHVAMIDIDDFKTINDKYGHDVGDQVLIEIAHIMKNNLRNDDMLFRWGGEEFLIIIAQPDLSHAFMALDKLRRIIADHRFSIHNLHVTVTGGLVLLDSKNISNCIKECDKKMYKGKAGAKNIIII